MEADGHTVHLAGELDLAGVPAASAALVPTDGDLAVDCSALTFLDVAGLEVLVGAHQTCQAAGVELVVVDPAPCLTRLLALTDLDQLFTVRWTHEQH